MLQRVLLLSLALSAAVAAQSAESDDAKPDAVGRPPWHLVDYWWDFGDAVPFTDYSIDLEIGEGIDPAVRLYIGAVGLGHLDGKAFYGGLQTQSDGFLTAEDRRRQYIGPGVIFSRWDERSLEAARRSEGGLFESGGYEGQFISVRNRYAWGPGRYTYAVRRQETVLADGKPHTWAGAFVLSHATGQERYVGALRFAGDALKLDGKLATFVEIYGSALPLERIPRTTIRFGGWRINGRPVLPRNASAHYPRDVPQVLQSEVDGDGIKAVLGEAAIDRAAVPGIRRYRDRWIQPLRIPGETPPAP